MHVAPMGKGHSVSWKKSADLRRQMMEILRKVLATGHPWAPVACWAVLIYLLSSYYGQGWLSTTVRVYVLQPLLWLSLAFMGFGGMVSIQ